MQNDKCVKWTVINSYMESDKNADLFFLFFSSYIRMAPSTGQRDIIVVSTIIKMGLQAVHNSIFVAPLGLLCTSILNYSQPNNK